MQGERAIRERVAARKEAEEYLQMMFDYANGLSGQAKTHFVRTLATGLNPAFRAIGLIVIEESKVILQSYIKKEMNKVEREFDESEEDIKNLLE